MPITPLSELIPPAIESKDHDICIDPEVDAGSNLKKRKVTDQALTYSNTDALGVSGIDGGALGVSGITVGDKLLAKGRAPNGETAWFQAEVIGLKQAQSSPSIFIKYTKTIDGCIDQQALPCPQYELVFKVDTMVAREDTMVVAPVVVAASSSVGQVALCEQHGWRAPTQMLEQCPTTGGGETTDEDDEADNTAPALRGEYVGLSGVRSNGTAVLDFSKHPPVSELCPMNPNAVEARVAATGGRTYTQSRLVFGVCACTQHSPLTTNPHH